MSAEGERWRIDWDTHPIGSGWLVLDQDERPVAQVMPPQGQRTEEGFMRAAERLQLMVTAPLLLAAAEAAHRFLEVGKAAMHAKGICACTLADDLRAAVEEARGSPYESRGPGP